MDNYNEFVEFCLENEITIDSQLHKTIKKWYRRLGPQMKQFIVNMI